MHGRISERWGHGADDIVIAFRVYLVSDDKDFREKLVLSLSGLGLSVAGFDSAASLYRAYAAQPPDVIVLDIRLGGEDSLSIASHLRTSQSVGIVLVTARDSVDDRINGLRAGADACLARPVDFRELAATVVALNGRLNRVRRFRSPQVPSGLWLRADGCLSMAWGIACA